MSSSDDMMAAQETGWGVDDLAGWGGSEFNSDFSSSASLTAATSPASGMSGMLSALGSDPIGSALVGLLNIEAIKATKSSPSQQYASLQNPAFSANSGATRQDVTSQPAGLSTGMMVGIGVAAVLVLILVLRK